MRKIEVLDSTLREGGQRESINFSRLDKLKIVKQLDSLGVDYIEIASPMFGQNNGEIFEDLKSVSLNAKIVAFGRTCKPESSPEDDPAIADLLSAGTEYVSIYGKCWDEQVEKVLRTTWEENVRIVTETIAYLVSKGRKVFFDAEHFFDGYAASPEKAMELLKAAEKAGACLLCLCDTRGGHFPETIAEYTAKVKAECSVKIAIHAHNDGGMADASSASAVFAGADQIQGTINGIGERCGNANLATCIANLQLKKGYTLIPENKLRHLTKVARAIAQTCNFSTSGMPYVSRTAFSHKAGTHIDAVIKDPRSFEHIDPSIIGNKRNILVSGLSGRSAIMPLLQAFAPNIDRQSPETDKLLEVIKDHETLGYQYESAHASLELLIRKTLGIHKSHFRVERFKLFTEQTDRSESNAPVLDTSVSKTYLPMGLSSAFVKISVDGKSEMAAAESDGPVNALDTAIRKALYVFYPQLKEVSLVDYKVRIIDGSTASGATVRVMIDTSNGTDTFTTIGVSADIIEASKQAIIDSLEYALYKADKEQ